MNMLHVFIATKVLEQLCKATKQTGVCLLFISWWCVFQSFNSIAYLCNVSRQCLWMQHSWG